MKKLVWMLALAPLAFAACQQGGNEQRASQQNADSLATAEKPTEQWRPTYHFTPLVLWTNDPNGLVYHNGEYHLFYQHNPYDKVWGHMHWGHAVSNDLLNWEHLPIAIAEDTAMIFSGSAVVDARNTAGFAAPTDSGSMVAIYTAHRILDTANVNNYLQTQHIAYSTDQGRTWAKYANNPVIDLNKKDFRDPKVFWYEKGKHWVMAVNLATEHQTQFYHSPNLKNWKLAGTFGPEGNANIPWECPDVFELPVENEPGRKKWVLLISAEGPYAGYQGMQYFVGNFDGKNFKNDNPKDKALYFDYGRDYFAAVTYENLPAADGRRLLLGWISNWAYANQTPTHPWRNGMALPRELALHKTAEGYRLVQKPLREVQRLRKKGENLTNTTLGGEELSLDDKIKGNVLEIVAEIDPQNAAQVGIKVLKGSNEETIIGYDAAKQQLYIDRSRSGIKPNEKFTNIDSAPLALNGKPLQLHIFIDKSTVEVFANGGLVSLSNVVFPSAGSQSIGFFALGGTAKLSKAEIWNLE